MSGPLRPPDGHGLSQSGSTRSAVVWVHSGTSTRWWVRSHLDPSPTGLNHLTLISPRSANPLEAGVVAKLTFDPCTQLNSAISSGTYA